MAGASNAAETDLRAWGMRDRVLAVSSCRLKIAPGRWGFAADHADAIDAHWARRRAEHPAMFNGVIHLMAAARLRDGALEGQLIATDFKSLLYWKEHDYPEAGVRDAFGSALIVSADGHVLLGLQRPGQLNSGFAYLPGGLIDHRDVATDGSIDIGQSVARELAEETGLIAADVARRPGFLLTLHGALASIAVVYRVPQSSEQLVAAVRRHIAADAEPELEDVAVICGPVDLASTRLAPYARVLLTALYAGDPALAGVLAGA